MVGYCYILCLYHKLFHHFLRFKKMFLVFYFEKVLCKGKGKGRLGGSGS